MIVDNAQNLVKEKYDWNMIARDMENSFKKIVNEKDN